MINQRIFSANVGDSSVGIAGPDAIEQDLDNLFANDQELSLKVIWKALNYKTELDKPSAYPNEQVTVFVTTQAWQGVANLIIRTEKYNNNVAIQYLQPNGSLITPVMYRLAIPDLDTWAAWEKIATNKQPNWIAATLQNGWTGDFYYRKNNIGQLEIMFGQLTAGTVADFTTITTFPIGFKPGSSSPIVVYNESTGESMTGFVVISATGDLKIRVPASTKIVTGNLISTHSLY